MTNPSHNRESIQQRAQRIKEVLTLTDVAQRYGLNVRKAGKEYRALCPFHDDRNPSLSLNDDKGVYLCRSCRASGDHLDITAHLLDLTVGEAAARIEQDFGLTQSQPSTGSAHRQFDRISREQGYEVLERAWHFFQKQLLDGDDPSARTARDTIARRGLNRNHLGLAPGRYRLDEQAGINVSAEALADLGLLRRGDNGRYRLFFRDRLVFALTDERGRVVGFAGRHLDPEQGPKYINSPETPWFHKSRVLYAPALTDEPDDDDQRSGEQPVQVVEGYTDALRLYSHGFDARAVMGLALSPTHARALAATGRPIELVYDADTAGQNALWDSMMAMLHYIDRNERVSVVTLEAGSDPDDYVEQHGPEAFVKLARVNWQQWLVNQCRDRVRQARGPIGQQMALTRLTGDIQQAIETRAPQLANVVTDWISRQVLIDQPGGEGESGVSEGIQQWLVRFLAQPNCLRQAIQRAQPPESIPAEPLAGLSLLMDVTHLAQALTSEQWRGIDNGWGLIVALNSLNHPRASAITRSWVNAIGNPVSVLTHQKALGDNAAEKLINEWIDLMRFLHCYRNQAPIWSTLTG